MITSTDIVLDFMDRINRHDPEKLAELMTEDHVFVDGLGNSMQGRDQMLQGWKGYFAFCPDFRVTHDALLADGERVAVFGHAGGTIAFDGLLSPQNAWRTPAAWLAVVAGDKVKEWHVYADNKPVYDILARPTRK